ncbi:protein of unknown function [Burkholderia multivorans]
MQINIGMEAWVHGRIAARFAGVRRDRDADAADFLRWFRPVPDAGKRHISAIDERHARSAQGHRVMSRRA